MSTLSKQRRQARANLASAAAAARRGNPDAQGLVDQRRREYRFVAAEDYIRELVDQAPPLTDEQRRRLAAILQAEAA